MPYLAESLPELDSDELEMVREREKAMGPRSAIIARIDELAGGAPKPPARVAPTRPSPNLLAETNAHPTCHTPCGVRNLRRCSKGRTPSHGIRSRWHNTNPVHIGPLLDQLTLVGGHHGVISRTVPNTDRRPRPGRRGPTRRR